MCADMGVGVVPYSPQGKGRSRAHGESSPAAASLTTSCSPSTRLSTSPLSTPSSKSPQPGASAWPRCSRGCVASPSSCLPVSPRCLALVLTAAMWWLYFGREDHDSEVLQEHVPAQRRPRTAVYSFGYAYFVIVSASPSPRSGWRRRSIPSITHPRPARRAPACQHLPIPGRSRRLSPDAVRHLTARPAGRTP